VTRIFIVADSTERASAMAELLEDEERLEVSGIDLADVVLALGVPLRRLPRRGKPVVAVSPEGDGDAPFDDSLKAWLPSGAAMEEIIAALLAAASGLTVLTQRQSRRTFRNSQVRIDTDLEPEPLTPRENEVLQMLAAGLGNKQIAAKLLISTNTAKFHVAQILAKLDANSRTEAVSLGIRRGLVPI
jgi:DNA-binding CsgD family transcriptional regulator